MFNFIFKYLFKDKKASVDTNYRLSFRTNIKHTFFNKIIKNTFSSNFKYYLKKLGALQASRFKSFFIYHKQVRVNNWRYFVRLKHSWRWATTIFWNNPIGAWFNYFLLNGVDAQGIEYDLTYQVKSRRRKITFKRYRKLKSHYNRYSRPYTKETRHVRLRYPYIWRCKGQLYGLNNYKKVFLRDRRNTIKKIFLHRLNFFGRIRMERVWEKYKWSFFPSIIIPKVDKRRRRLRFWTRLRKGLKYILSALIFLNIISVLLEIWSEYMIKRRNSKTPLIWYDRITFDEINRYFYRIDYFSKRSSQLFFIFYLITHLVRVCGGKPIFKNPTNNFIDVLQTLISFCFIKINKKLRTSCKDIKDDIIEWLFFKDIYWILLPVLLYWYFFYFYFLFFILETEPNIGINTFQTNSMIVLQEIHLYDLHYRSRTDDYEDIDEFLYLNRVVPPSWHSVEETNELFKMSDFYTYQSLKPDAKHIINIGFNQIYFCYLELSSKHTWYQKYYGLYFINLNPIIQILRSFYWEFFFVLTTISVIYINTNNVKFNVMRSLYKTMYILGDRQFYHFEYYHTFHEVPIDFKSKLYWFCTKWILDPLYWFVYKLIEKINFYIHMKKVKRIFFRSHFYVRFSRNKFKTFLYKRKSIFSFFNKYFIKSKPKFYKTLRIISYNNSIIKNNKKIDWVILTQDGEDIEDDLLWWNCNTLKWDEERQNVLRQ